MSMWMAHAASEGSLFQPFITGGLVAIGWADVGALGAARLDMRDTTGGRCKTVSFLSS